MPSSKFSYRHDDVCIVGFGCVLPNAANPNEYWQNLVNNHSALTKTTESRWPSAPHFDSAHSDKNKTYVDHGCFVKDEIIKQCAINLDAPGSQNTRLSLMTQEATRQAVALLSTQNLEQLKCDIILGCMAADQSIEKLALRREYQRNLHLIKRQQEKSKVRQQTQASIENYFQQNSPADIPAEQIVLTSSVIKQLKDRFAINGEGFLIDAACASSLAAISNACYRLRSGDCDLALSGGIEADLGASTFTLFSSVGALSKSTCKPFDKNADGLVQGEGAVVFALQRLDDALLQKNTIYGVIKACAGASDGRSSSLFSPSIPGQILAYQRAYRVAGNNPPDYIECHGTGTAIGDSTELNSLNLFFNKSQHQPICIGSGKAFIGHTKGAAGAAGLLKCVLSMRERQLPGSSYFSGSTDTHENIVVNQQTKTLPDNSHLLRMGISSFGFGNINYHLVLDEFSVNSSIRIASYQPKEEDIVVIAQSRLPVESEEKIHEQINSGRFQIPPLSLPQTDPLQLRAVLLIEKLLKEAGIHSGQLDNRTTSVLAASTLGLPKAWEFSARIGYDRLIHQLSPDLESAQALRQQQTSLTPVTEDIGPGILNNIISAKVTNTKDFNGTNYNVDADNLSLPAAISCARYELSKDSSVVIVIGCEDIFCEGEGIPFIERGELFALALCTRSTALEKALPIQSILRKTRYSE